MQPILLVQQGKNFGKLVCASIEMFERVGTVNLRLVVEVSGLLGTVPPKKAVLGDDPVRASFLPFQLVQKGVEVDGSRERRQKGAEEDG